jgi:hypothetical protein
VGQTSAETVREIEQTRENLEGKLLALEERMPASLTAVKRIVGIAVGGGMGGTAFWFAVRRVRARKRKKEEAERPITAVVNLVPERWADKLGEVLADERAKQWAAGAFGIWLIVKIAEVRQLRALRRAPVGGI